MQDFCRNCLKDDGKAQRFSSGNNGFWVPGIRKDKTWNDDSRRARKLLGLVFEEGFPAFFESILYDNSRCGHCPDMLLRLTPVTCILLSFY